MDEILIYSDIGDSFFGEGVSADDVVEQLKGKGDVTVRINSVGGDVFQGFAIHNALKSHEGAINVVVDGIAASAASVIAMAGDTIAMHDNAMMMIHDPWTMAMGSAEDFLKSAEILGKIKDSIVATYTNRTGLEADAVSEMMAAETWFTADQAIEQGFAFSKVQTPAKAVNSLSKPWINKAPKVLPEATNEAQTNWQIALRRRRLDLLD